jgi:ankyrin repeat protein
MKHITPCLGALLFVAVPATADSKAQLQKALFAEEVEQDQAKAIAIYQRLIDQAADGPRHLAVARFRLAKLHQAAGRLADALTQLKAITADPDAPADWVVQANKLIEAASPASSRVTIMPPSAIYERLKDRLWYWHSGTGEPLGALRFLPDGKLETTCGVEALARWLPMGGNRFRMIQNDGRAWGIELSEDGRQATGITAPGAVDPSKFLELHPNPSLSIDEAEIEILKKLLETQPDRIAALRIPCNLARLNRTKALKFLIDRGIPVDLREKDSVYFTPLMFAVEHGELDTVRFLLDHGADVNALDKRGVAPLFIAAWRGHAGIVSLLIDRGAQLENSSSQVREADKRMDHGTALHGAVQQGHTAIVKLLLERGANINAVSPGKFLTPLVCALAMKDFEMATMLLDRGASPNLPASGISNPLRQMAYQGNLAMLRRLLDRGARLDMQSDELFNHFGLTRTVGAALPVAAREGHLEVAKVLVAAGSPVDQTTPRYLETPLHAAALHGNTATCKWLIEQGAKINHRLADDVDFQSGWTPLHSAVWGESLDVVKLLMEKSASPEEPCGDKGLRRSAFHLAVLKGWLPVAKAILEQPVYQNLDARKRLLSQADSDGNTALHLAVSIETKPDLELVRLLITSGAPRDAFNKLNQTPRDLSLDPGKGGKNDAVRDLLNP